MNYYKALQREKTERWDYTCTNDGKTHAVGYCSGKYESIRNDTSLPNHERYHDYGHDTEEGACACYKRYLLDNSLVFGTMSGQQKCQICKAWDAGDCSRGHEDVCAL